jgi:hypothetical protein
MPSFAHSMLSPKISGRTTLRTVFVIRMDALKEAGA